MEYVHTPTLVPQSYLKRVFSQSNEGGVVIVTSTLPGQGKTEEIQRMAYEQDKMYDE